MRKQSRGVRRRWKAREKIKSAVGTKSPARGETRLRGISALGLEARIKRAGLLNTSSAAMFRSRTLRVKRS